MRVAHPQLVTPHPTSSPLPSILLPFPNFSPPCMKWTLQVGLPATCWLYPWLAGPPCLASFLLSH